MIIVCDNTNIAELFFRKISGEDEVEIVEENGGNRGRRRRKDTRTVYGQGAVFPDLLSNDKDLLRTLRIDSKMLADAESEDPGKNRAQAAEDLRQIVATIGKPGKPGEQVRCVVSVAMLNGGLGRQQRHAHPPGCVPSRASSSANRWLAEVCGP